jgi:tRNA nucleotidyltransferase (CCA-adding enzyme)
MVSAELKQKIQEVATTGKVSAVIPSYVTDIARILEKEGYEAYLVGGGVRDIVMGVEPQDYDIATNAKPEALLSSFPKAVATGVKYGTVLILSKDKNAEKHGVEVTTYRSEENYVDGRWPSKVEFVDKINQDLGRRDFTINALAIDLLSVDHTTFVAESNSDWSIIDLFKGLSDLEQGMIRAVGTPLERFSEDGLRAFRACRLASQLDFQIEEATFEAIKASLHIAKRISPERIRDEFMKMLLKSAKPSKGIELLREAGLLELMMPELLEGMGITQKLFHNDDVYKHILATVDVAEDSVKLPALFHDIAKPRCADGNGHFYGHDKMGAEMAEQIMRRLKFSNDEIKRIKTLVKNHMFYYPFYETEQEASPEQKTGYWTDAAIRRFIKRVGEENIDDLFKLRIADAEGNPKSAWDPREIVALEERISAIREQDMALKVEDLSITGHDLAELGIQKGPEMGKILNELLEKVLDDPALNQKEKLIEIVQQEYTLAS